MALYCNTCGASNPDGSDYCSRCGAQIASVQSTELVLPDWLKQAAAESSAPVRARTAAPEAPVDSAAVARAPIPSGDLATSIPAWLSNPLHAAAPPAHEESLLTDPTDTKGFITEDDLPAWIRQIAVEEDARRSERAAQPPEPIVDPLDEARPPEPAPARRRLLPGEIDAARPAAKPRLVRSEHGAVETEPAAATEPAPQRAKSDEDKPASSPSRTLHLPSRDELTLRHALIGAVAVAVIVLLLVLLV